MAEELLSLKWNNHQSHFVDILTFLREQEIFVDATLACGGKLYAAHKFVLSTCSEYFKQMFIKNPAKHPIVFMKDVTSRDLEALLDFMYNGEVNVPQSSLGSLIKTAEGLQIKGLAVPDDPPAGKRDNKDNVCSGDKRERDSKSSLDNVPSPPPKRPRARERSPPHSYVPALHSSPPPRSRSPNTVTIKTQPIESSVDEDSRTSVQSGVSGHSEQLSQNASLKSDVNNSNKFNSDKLTSLANDSSHINPSSDEPSPGPSGMQHASKEEEMEIKQEDVVDLGDDDEGDWGSGGGGEDGIGDSSLGSEHNNASNFSDMMLPHGEGGLGGSGDPAMDIGTGGVHYPWANSSYVADRPHGCNFCGKRFINTSHLRDHIRLHTGERPFKCRTCGKTFVQNQHLRQHEKKSRCTPHPCHLCNDVFPNQRQLTIHMATTHLLLPSVVALAHQ